MAKKFVRGVTGVDDIEKLDKSLTNVNDLISDGQNTYVHTKKGKYEFYYKVTDGVTSVNSTGDTITVEKSDDGSLKLDTNPLKVLEHDNLLTDYGISKTTSGNTTKLGLEYTEVPDGFDLNSLANGRIIGNNLINAPNTGWWFIDTLSYGYYIIQKATMLNYPNTQYLRLKWDNAPWLSWREQVGDKSIIDGLLAQKQNKIENNGSISPSGNGLRQLLTDYQTYTHTNGILKTYSKWVSSNLNPDTQIFEEAYFTVEINKGATSATFTINETDKIKFNKIMTSYGQNNTVRISGCIFTLSGSTLTVTTTNNIDNNYVTTFRDIL